MRRLVVVLGVVLLAIPSVVFAAGPVPSLAGCPGYSGSGGADGGAMFSPQVGSACTFSWGFGGRPTVLTLYSRGYAGRVKVDGVVQGSFGASGGWVRHDIGLAASDVAHTVVIECTTCIGSGTTVDVSAWGAVASNISGTSQSMAQVLNSGIKPAQVPNFWEWDLFGNYIAFIVAIGLLGWIILGVRAMVGRKSGSYVYDAGHNRVPIDYEWESSDPGSAGSGDGVSYIYDAGHNQVPIDYEWESSE